MFRFSVRLSAYISATRTERISVKFYIGGFYEKSSEKIQIWLKSGTIHEDLSTLYCRRRHYNAFKAFFTSEMVSGC
jgi:hypothetical protein